jgi:hypothetical protein
MTCLSRHDAIAESAILISMELYVYYQARCELSQEIQETVCAMQAALSNEHKVHTLLKRRPDARDGRYTWMEVYTNAGTGFQAALEKAVEATGIERLIDGERHTEVFVDATCA